MARVGLAEPLALLALPVALAGLWLLVRPERADSRRRRLTLFASRALVLALLVAAAAGPFTVEARQTSGDPRVTMLVDRSESMGVFDVDSEALAAAVEARGVPVSQVVVASGNRSQIGDAVVSHAEPGGSVLLVSDGQVTGGRSLSSAAELARLSNATLYALNLSSPAPERHVSLAGPAKTSVGLENTFRLSVGGTASAAPARVTISVDGTPVGTETVPVGGAVEFAHAFETSGGHRLTAAVEGDDAFAVNDVVRKTVRVVDRPRVLYVSRGDYPLRGLLEGLYDVTAVRSLPADLDPYYAVVVQDVPASDLGNVDALASYVADGNGLVAVGGRNAYENGGYAESPLSSLLPVAVGDAGGRGRSIVLAVDVSGSTADGMRVQKALALDVLDQLGEDNLVGLVAFNQQAYRIADLTPLATDRERLVDLVRRLNSGGATRIGFGLQGAADVLGGREGTVILITDGLDDSADVIPSARQLGDAGVRVVTVGVGAAVNERLLRQIAEESDGTYLRADETSRLRLLFGDETRRFTASSLTIVDATHFVTSGVETRANPTQSNDVTVKEGADYLVATGDGTPALAAWRYGLGRVVSVTAYGEDGTLDGLLSRPDSLLLSKSVNWVIGDPERKAEGVVTLPDTRVGEPTRAVYAGSSRPSVEGVQFVRDADGRYVATLVPRRAGFASLLGVEYAVNYPREYAAVGQSEAIERSVAVTGGRLFEPGDADAVAETVRRRAVRVEEVRTDWAWAALVAALAVYLLEVAIRRLQLYTRVDRTTTH